MKDFFSYPKKRKRKVREEKPVYQFDIDGNFVFKHASIAIAAENLFLHRKAILSAIQRKSCCGGRKWFFS